MDRKITADPSIWFLLMSMGGKESILSSTSKSWIGLSLAKSKIFTARYFISVKFILIFFASLFKSSKRISRYGVISYPLFDWWMSMGLRISVCMREWFPVKELFEIKAYIFIECRIFLVFDLFPAIETNSQFYVVWKVSLWAYYTMFLSHGFQSRYKFVWIIYFEFYCELYGKHLFKSWIGYLFFGFQ